MRLLILATLLLSFFSLAHAEEKQDKIVRIKTKRKMPAILLNPKLDLIPLEKLRFNTNRVSREQIEQRLRSGGGDDVGNGGDEIRRQILELIQEIKQEVGPGYQIPDLSTKGLAVVSGLTLNGKVLPAANSSEGILINKAAWIDLKREKIDTRILLLELLFISAEKNDKALSIYSSLKTEEGFTPFCSEDGLAHKLVKTASSETLSGDSSTQALSSQALKLCHKKDLNECRIIETGKKGFGSWAKNFATYQGFKFSTAKLSKVEIKKQACSLAKSCEQIYELAPMGQVSMEAFSKVEAKVERFCF